jgi:hypothetical protein
MEKWYLYETCQELQYDNAGANNEYAIVMTQERKQLWLIYVLRRLAPREYSTESVLLRLPTGILLRVRQQGFQANHCSVRVVDRLSRTPMTNASATSTL